MNTKNKTNKTTIKRLRDLLWDKDLDVAKLSRRIGKSRTWTSLVLYGQKQSPITQKSIALALGMKTEDIWPNNKYKKAA